MSFKRLLKLFLPIISLSAFSCSYDFGNVPEGAQITCKSTSECPGGWVCNTTIEFCVKSIDPTPPSFETTPELSSGYLKSGATATLNFRATKDLLKTPEVNLSRGNSNFSLVLDESKSSGRDYVFTYTAMGNETEFVDYAVLVTMTDKSGNTAEGKNAGKLQFQFHAPVMDQTTLQLAGSPVKNGGTVKVSFTLNRAVSTDPVVTIERGRTFTKESSSGGVSFVYSYTASTVDTTDGTQIEKALTIDATDEAGNKLSQVLDKKVSFDFKMPALVGEATLTPEAVKLAGAVTTVFESDEELGSDPVAMLGVIQMAKTARAGNKYTFAHIADSTDEGKDGRLSIRIIDRAGNESDIKTTKSVQFDFTGPQITIGPVLSKDPAFYKKGDTPALTFTANKSLDLSNTFVSLKTETPISMPCVPSMSVSETAQSYICSAAAPFGGTETPVGLVSVSIELADQAGNKAYTSTSLMLDFVPPGISAGSYVQMQSNYPENPVINVTALTNGTTVVANFSVDEDLAADSPAPYAVLCKNDICEPKDPAQVAVLTLDQSGSTGRKFRFSEKITILGSGLDFTSKIYLVPGPGGGIRDLAGNEQTGAVEISSVKVNTKQPSTPIIANVYYRRVPWGQKGSDGKFVDKNFTVVCNACQFSTDVEKILIYDSDTPSSGGLIGEYLNPHNGSAFGFDPIKLNGSDRAHIWMATADSAGNISPAAEIKSAEWVATMGYKVPGSTVENPHMFYNVAIHENKLLQEQMISEPEVFSPQLVFRPTLQAGGQNWQKCVYPEDYHLPIRREKHAISYDSTRGKTILFGGYDGQNDLDDTWEWNGENWTQCFSSLFEYPSKRSGHAMVYETGRGRTLMFGGSSGGDETWAWDGQKWIQLKPTVVPTARSFHAMAYDSTHGKTVLFGGGGFNDTWEWDGSIWKQVYPQTSPSIRSFHVMSYDSDRNRIVLFGGRDAAGQPLNDTWEWDGKNWSEKLPLTKPYKSEANALVYDGERNLTILSTEMGFWSWNGDNWSGFSAPNSQGKTAYDNARKVIIIFGGGSYLRTNETWELRGTNWIKMLQATASPPKRFNHAVAYDSIRDKVVMFGGNDGYNTLDDTWEWDHSVSWQSMTPVTSPFQRYGHTLAFDIQRKKVILFGGSNGTDYFNDTWEWDGNAWTHKSPVNSPPARAFHVLSYDKSRKVTVLYGGYGMEVYRDTWEWDGENWTQKNSMPPITFLGLQVYNVLMGKVIFFALNSIMEAFQWDGVSWRTISTAGFPNTRQNSVIAYDDTRGKVLLYGEKMVDEYFNDTWEWNGKRWTQQHLFVKPSYRDKSAIVYNEKQGKMVLFGGHYRHINGPDSCFNDTWIFDSQGNGRPAQITKIDVKTLGNFQDDKKPQVREIISQFTSGGIGYPWEDMNQQVKIVKGVNLMAWYDNEWHSLASNGDSAKSPGLVEWSTTDATVIDKLFYGGGMKYNFAVVPVAPNGFGDPDCIDPETNHCDMGQVSTEYMEVTVKYTLP